MLWLPQRVEVGPAVDSSLCRQSAYAQLSKLSICMSPWSMITAGLGQQTRCDLQGRSLPYEMDVMAAVEAIARERPDFQSASQLLNPPMNLPMNQQTAFGRP